MPRMPREKSQTGIYHVMLRGINRQTLFEDEEDCKKFLQIINECMYFHDTQESEFKKRFELMAYCLMGNHVHLLMKEEKEPLDQIFKRIGARYVFWFNHKYERVGHLFQDRFKSEPVNDSGYFLTVLRYIHQNPVMAGLCKDISKYKWSSYNDYIEGSGITEAEFALSMFNEDRKKGIMFFKKHMNEEEKTSCLDIDEKHRPTDKEAQEIVRELCKIKNIVEFQNLNPEKRDKSIALLKEKGLSIRQISRLTGISFGIVRKA